MSRSLLRIRDVTARVGFAKSTVYKLIQDGKFPAPIKPLDGYGARWNSDDIDRWIESAIARAKAECRKS